MNEQNNSTNCGKIYPTLRDRIALLDYKPGETLQEEELVEEFGCSRTPIRKAFILLEEKGLIERVPKKGTYISPIDCQSLQEYFKLRKHLLQLVSDQAINNIQPEQLSVLEDIVQEISQTEDQRELIQLDLKFHRTLYQATHNELLKQIMNLIIVKTFRIWLFLSGTRLPSGTKDDFSSLIGAIKNKNKEKVEEVLTSHSRHAVEYLRQELANI